jgi:hypothetical protein
VDQLTAECLPAAAGGRTVTPEEAGPDADRGIRGRRQAIEDHLAAQGRALEYVHDAEAGSRAVQWRQFAGLGQRREITQRQAQGVQVAGQQVAPGPVREQPRRRAPQDSFDRAVEAVLPLQQGAVGLASRVAREQLLKQRTALDRVVFGAGLGAQALENAGGRLVGASFRHCVRFP